MKAKVYVTLKDGILDPQGKAIERALSVFGFTEVTQVRVGKYMEVDIAPGAAEAVEARVKEMCEKLLANTVIEKYQFTVDPGQ